LETPLRYSTELAKPGKSKVEAIRLYVYHHYPEGEAGERRAELMPVSRIHEKKVYYRREREAPEQEPIPLPKWLEQMMEGDIGKHLRIYVTLRNEAGDAADVSGCILPTILY